MGQKAAEIDRPLLERAIKDAQLVFLCMGGGTEQIRTVIAEIAKQQGAITLLWLHTHSHLKSADPKQMKEFRS